jgi:hypothetical protein
MKLSTFRESLTSGEPPAGLTTALQALWYAGKDQWDEAHTLVQNSADNDGAWVHAYLHRVEGDLSNAGYWYARAGKPASSGALEDEWTQIATALLSTAD